MRRSKLTSSWVMMVLVMAMFPWPRPAEAVQCIGELNNALNNFPRVGDSYLMTDFNLVSFNTLTSPQGTIGGRVAVQHQTTFPGPGGVTVGTQVTTPSKPFSLTTATILWQQGSLLPANERMFVANGTALVPAYLSSRVTTCPNAACRINYQTQLNNLRTTVAGWMTALINHAPTAFGTVVFGGLNITVNSAGRVRYYLHVTATQLAQINYYRLDPAIPPTAEMIIVVDGTDNVVITGGSFPLPSNQVLWVIPGVRNVAIVNTGFVGSIFAIDANINQASSSLEGFVIGNNLNVQSLNFIHCTSFSTPGTSCFVPGTQILMADSTTKPIETIQPGDMIKDMNGVDTQVLFVTQERLVNRLLFGFNGMAPFATVDHPFVESGGRTASMHPAWLQSMFPEKTDIDTLGEGTTLVRVDSQGVQSPLVVNSITYSSEANPDYPVYTLFTNNLRTCSYVANGMAVYCDSPDFYVWPEYPMVMAGLLLGLGPNLPSKYPVTTLAEIDAAMRKLGAAIGQEMVNFAQQNFAPFPAPTDVYLEQYRDQLGTVLPQLMPTSMSDHQKRLGLYLWAQSVNFQFLHYYPVVEGNEKSAQITAHILEWFQSQP